MKAGLSLSPRLWSFVGRGTWSLLDQAIMALGAFSINVVVARSAGQSDFGQFALVNSTMTLLVSVTGSLVAYPLTLRAAKHSSGDVGRLASIAVALAIPVVLATAPILMLLIGFQSLWSSYPVILLALIAKQVQAVLRAGLISRLEFHRVVPGDVIAQLGSVALLVLVVSRTEATLSVVFTCIFVANILAALLQSGQLRLVPVTTQEVRAEARSYWNAGKWAALNNYLNSGASMQLFPWVLGALHGAASVATYQAVSTVSNVVAPISNGISAMVLPSVARSGVGKGKRSALLYGSSGLVLMSPILLAAWLIPDTILSAVYGDNSPYVESGNLVRLFTLLVVLRYLSTIITTLLQGLNLAKSASIGSIASFLCAALICWPVIHFGGVPGTILGLMVVVVVRLIINIRTVQSAHKE